MSFPDFASAAQIAMPQLATPTAPGSLVSTAVSAARALRSGSDSFRNLGLAMRFKVEVQGVGSQGLGLGLWTSCEGLKVDFEFEPVRSGGDYVNSYVLPKVVSYGRVTLKRAVEKKHSAAVQKWLKQVAAAWRDGADISEIARVVTISMLDVYLNPEEPAATWNLQNAFPFSWSGPSMNAKSSEIASETLVLEHDGFLE